MENMLYTLCLTQMVAEILVNIWLGNGLLPDGSRPLPEPILFLVSEVL